MNIEQVLNSIKNNDVSSNYLLYGEEDFFIDKIANSFLKNIIPESEKIFNQKIFYGKQTDVFSLLSVVKSFPMTGDRQLVVLKEAQKLSNITELTNYFTSPIKSTVLVVCYKNKTIDKRKKWVKAIQKNGIVIESKALYGQQISRWIQYNLAEAKIKIEKPAEALLIDFLGNDLSKITNAINKLSNIITNGIISIENVHSHIGVHRHYNTFELQNALASKDSNKVILIVDYFISNQKQFPLPIIIGLLFSFYSKLIIMHSNPGQSDSMIAGQIKVHPFFIKVYKTGCKTYTFQDCIRIISLLREADLKSKGIHGNFNYDFLKDLVLRIIFK